MKHEYRDDEDKTKNSQPPEDIKRGRQQKSPSQEDKIRKMNNIHFI